MKNRMQNRRLSWLTFLMAGVFIAGGIPACAPPAPTPAPTAAPAAPATKAPEPKQQPAAPATRAPTTAPAAPATKAPEPKQAPPEKVYTFSFQSMQPSTHVSAPIIKLWADRVEQRSRGQIKINLFWAGQLVGPNEGLDALGKGSIEGLLVAPTLYSGKVPVGDISAMPYNAKDMADLYDLWFNTPVREIVEQEYRQKANAEVIGFQTTDGYPLLMARNKAVTKLEDMKGLKIRGGGGAMNEILKALGATPVTTVAAETVLAMERGTIDGSLLTYPSIESYKMYDVVTDITEPYIIPVLAVFFWVNLDKYNSLPENLRPILKQVWRDNQQEDIKAMSDDAAKTKEKVLAKGTRIHTLPKEELARWRQALMPVWDWYGQRTGDAGQRIKNAIQARW
ncbi:MAG: TRAP transporter substrate-binding protein DctP [Chloroflexi bacterium]|nr:TRAP transporter substrate-binding protein DctP [Chloroflexota bacterium]